MKHFRLLLFTFVALEAIGVLAFVFLGPMEANGTKTIDLLPGTGSIGHLMVDTEGGGAISGDFTSDSGRQVLFMMLDEEQYDDLLAGQSYGTQFSEIAASGDFSVDRPAVEWYHIVIQHAAEPESAEQVTVTYTVKSMNWPITFGLTGFIFASGVLTAVVMIKQQKEKKAATGPLSPYLDVVIFDQDARR